MSILEKVFETTATFNKEQGLNGGYNHFGINKIFASMYGNKPEDVVNLKFKISENQEQNHTKYRTDNDYWGFYSFEEEKFILIFHQYFILDMCFTYGMRIEEEHNKGKAYRIEII